MSERILNPAAWAVGTMKPSGFDVRKICWGRLLARYEKRDGETYRRIKIVPYPAPGDRLTKRSRP